MALDAPHISKCFKMIGSLKRVFCVQKRTTATNNHHDTLQTTCKLHEDQFIVSCCDLILPWRRNSRKMSPRRGGMQLLDRIIAAIRISSAFPLPHSMYCLAILPQFCRVIWQLGNLDCTTNRTTQAS